MPFSVLDVTWRCMYAFISGRFDLGVDNMQLTVVDFTWGCICMHAVVSGRFYLEVHVCLYQWWIWLGVACMPLSVVDFTWRCMH